jgi:hypothetical protein
MPKTLTKDQLLPLLQEKVETLFQEVAFVRRIGVSKGKRRGEGPDLVVELTGETSSQVLLIEARTSGEPRIAREAVNALLVEKRLWPQAHPVFAAPYIAGEAAFVCQEHEVGFLDLAGNCRLAFDTLFIQTQGEANPYKSRRTLKTLGKPKSSRIIRVLLNQSRREWKTRDLAEEAGVSEGLVSQLKKILKDKEWIDPEKKTISLTRPGDLLEAWVHSVPFPGKTLQRFSSPLDVIRTENRIVETCQDLQIPYGFTGLSGAVHLVSGVAYRQVQVYVPEISEKLLTRLGFEQAESQTSIALLEAEDAGVLYGSRKVMPSSRLQYARPEDKTVQTIEAEIRVRLDIVSPVQIYCDLKSVFEGCASAADRLLKQVIQPSW